MIAYDYRCMYGGLNEFQYLNPSQTAVGLCVLPIYALKNIQWTPPSEFPQDIYFCFLGPLHIDHAALQYLRQLINPYTVGGMQTYN